MFDCQSLPQEEAGQMKGWQTLLGGKNIINNQEA
jgi:hypothetical protein